MKFKIKKISVLILLYAYQSINVIAAEDTTIPVVKVVDKKVKTSLTQPNIEQATQEINKTAGGVNIIDAEKLREGRMSNFNDTLGMATGVLAQSRFGAEETRLSIRGSGIQRTFHGRGIKLMQDGIPTNLADGGFDFPGIDPFATNYIEVYRGANALQYGASNLGGAINFISHTGHTAPKHEVRTEGGSFGYYKLGVSTAGVVGDLDYFLTVNTYGQQGYRDNSKQSADRVTGNVGYRISDNVETRFYAGYVSNDSQLPSTLTKDELKNTPKKSKLIPGQGINQRNVDIWRIANKTTFQWDKTKLELGAFYSYKDLFHPIIDLDFLNFIPGMGPAPTLGVIDQKTDDYGLYAKLNHQGKLFGLENDFIIGASPTYGKTDDKRFLNQNASRGALKNSFELTAYNYETYAENRLHLTPELTAIAGLQYTYSKRKATDKLITLTGDESFNRSYSQFNPKLGAIYQLNPTAQVFANVSRSFEPPSFGELVNLPTPEPLKAQDGVTYEVGTRGNREHIDWDVSVYHARLNNELLQVSTFPQYFGTTVNANRTQRTGLEMGMTARLPAHLEWRHTLAINDFRFDGDATYGNNRLPGIPHSLLRAELLYRHDGFYAGPTLEVSPESYAVDFAQNLKNDSYTLLGFKAGQQLTPQISWFIEGRNLTNRKYAATTGVTRSALSTESIFLPGDGSSVYGGLQWRY
jgi:iron complex outermembrane receptor protein